MPASQKASASAAQTVQDLCKPRKSVFEIAHRDYALNLTDFAQNKIDAEEFFSENFVTEGMETLLKAAFERFQGKSAVSIIKLTQAMGGGKTHNMIALGLLAANPQLRPKVEFSFHGFKDIVRVAAFSGRESDTPNGIWGEIARQIGKEAEFKEYYQNGLKAPGETAWVKLLAGDPLLILLDELPPYFENAAALTVGNSNLAVVTTTALANLITAANKSELSNILIVISDLKATYQGGTGMLSQAVGNLDNEVGRTALNLEPVRQNSDEVYNILRCKLFETLPSQDRIKEVADAFADELLKAQQMELAAASPSDFRQRILESYPFHPAIKDLYARFKENQGFQQTRGIIRLIRTLIRSLYKKGGREDIYLLSPSAFDLNDADTHTLITTQINSILTNAISHDIASEGNSEAERLDQSLSDPIHQDTIKTIFISSLATVMNSVRGLTESEIVQYLVSPGRDINQLKQKVLPALRTTCWYLHPDRDGKYVIKEIQNVIAKLNSIVSSINQDQSIKEIRDKISEMFSPVLKDVYQKLAVLPGYDTIKLEPETVLMVIHKPYKGGLDPELTNFYENQVYKNRILFLTGDRDAMDSLQRSAKELKGIREIIKEMQNEKVPGNDLQFLQANDLQDQFQNNFLSAARETFTKLYYPSSDKLMDADFAMKFISNSYVGEDQIRETLERKQKFVRETEDDTFRKKCEQRLFKGNELEWAEVKKRAAMQPVWQFHRQDALDKLKDRMLRQEFWKQNGKFIQISGFAKPETSLQISPIDRDPQTGAAILRLSPVNGDKVYFDAGADATESSMEIKDLARFDTTEMRLTFLCVDSTKGHPTGPVVRWQNTIDLSYSPERRGGKLFIRLKAIPQAEIVYTTDGSHPRDLGGSYSEPFEVKTKCVVMALARNSGIESNILQFEADPGKSGSEVDLDRPAVLKKNYEFSNTESTYKFIEAVRNCGATAIGARFAITAEGGACIDYSSFHLSLSGEQMLELLNVLRQPFFAGDGEGLPNNNVRSSVKELHFLYARDLQELAEKLELSYEPGEVRQ